MPDPGREMIGRACTIHDTRCGMHEPGWEQPLMSDVEMTFCCRARRDLIADRVTLHYHWQTACASLFAAAGRASHHRRRLR